MPPVATIRQGGVGAPPQDAYFEVTYDVPLPTASGGVLLGVAGVNGIPATSNLPWGATLLVEIPKLSLIPTVSAPGRGPGR